MPIRSSLSEPGAGPGPKSRGDAGFTLVELLVALVAGGIMAGGVVTLLMGQNRFYGSTDDAVHARQSLRATSDLLATELRMIHAADPGDLITADADRLTFRMDTHRGVVCEVSSDDVYVFLFSQPSAPNVKRTGRGHAVREAYRGSTWSYGGWDPMSGSFSRADSESHAIARTCEGDGGPTATDANHRQFVLFAGWGGASVPEDGAILRIFGEVTYEFGPSSFGSGTAIFRNGQELAAPFESDAAFSYVTGEGVRNSVGSGSFDTVERVRMHATARGDGGNRYDVARDLQFDVPLRN